MNYIEGLNLKYIYAYIYSGESDRWIEKWEIKSKKKKKMKTNVYVLSDTSRDVWLDSREQVSFSHFG